MRATLFGFLLAIGANASAMAQTGDFSAWLDGLRADAQARGITKATIEAALDRLEPIPRVIELDRRQPEGVVKFSTYRQRVVSAQRIADGKARLRDNKSLLDQVGARYGVQPRFVVALWGIETSYGRATGDYPVVAALATLAWDGRRSAFFRSELFDALAILDQGHIAASLMRGSWAGAMGQTQFMPSSFLRYAVDFDGDGRRDIWNTRADVFASAANYLAGVGWKGDQTWGRAVRLPAGLDRSFVGLETTKSLDEWRALGVLRADGGPLPQRAGLSGSLVQPDGIGTPAFLVYDNFRVILRWNRSTYFALSVGDLADRIGDG
jgi:membrane-bound lytic murein transglycosylase B